MSPGQGRQDGGGGPSKHVRRRLHLPADYQSPAHARAAVREVLAEAGLAGLLDEALLLTTELATNGVVHAGTDIDVDVVVDDAGVTVMVTDFESGSIGPTSEPDHFSESGRGLVLVDQFASAWGTTHGQDSKGVWFRLDRSPAPGQRPTGPAPAASPQRLDWLRFLSETSELLAQSLDAELTLALIPQLVVPRLGDWCAVHTADEWGTLTLATWLHRDETATPLLRSQLSDATPWLRDVVATRAPVTLPRPFEGVAVPLVARDQLLGTLSVGRHVDRLHSPDDVAVITDLARRAALALENARIHAEREQVAQAFQRALLPAALPKASGLEFGAEYVPAGTGTNVGGDFYDVRPLEHDRWLLSIGDVCGKGARAAALTGLVRDVLRVLVRDGCPLPRAMQLLNTTMLERGEGKHCTLAAAVASKLPDGRVALQLCLAGHDKPALLRANGDTELVGEGGTAVGLLDSVHTPLATVLLAPDDVLVFYTDGVTERRRGEELYGQDRLRRELAGLVGLPAPAVAARLRAATLTFSTEEPRDDIALLVLRNPAVSPVPSGGMTALSSSLNSSPDSVPTPGGDTPPVAQRIPRSRTRHGDTAVDEYAWLRNKDDPNTLEYLQAENDYTDQRTAHLANLRETLFTEIKSRTQETDLSVPVRKGNFWYYSRTVEGRQYAIHCRIPAGEEIVPPPIPADGSALPGEQVLLDENELAGDSEFFALGSFDISPDGTLLAYSTDYAGDERFTLRFKNLATGETLSDEVPNTYYGTAWSAAGDVLFYLTVDDAWRPHQVWRHALGSTGDDALVYEEADERFWVGVSLTRSEQYILIDLHSKITSEIRYLAADDPTGEFTVLGSGRREGVELQADHQGDRFIVLHNDNAENFVLAWTPVADTSQLHELIGHREDTRLLDIDAFADHIVVHFRRDGLTGLRILPNGGQPQEITFPEPVYNVSPHGNATYDTDTFRLSYNSLVTPDSVSEYDIASGELTLLKQRPVLGGYDPQRYEQHREWATAPDGTKVPISIMCRKGTPRDGSAPLSLYGYGSYEVSTDPWFSIARLSLVDRGFVFAIAHVRGGGELGRRWYDDGKLLRKKNTFTDFIACARHLAGIGWTSPGHTIARGGSAGGLLMGAIANMAPEVFGGIVAQVPFVDPVNTILDPSMPLTITEWEEWGNPLADPEVYAYMKSYSPYENVAGIEYPPILATAGLNDPRVGFHEAAKWVARLRAVGRGGPFLLKTEMGAGHMGPSGRYDAWREEAFVNAWTIDVAGIWE